MLRAMAHKGQLTMTDPYAVDSAAWRERQIRLLEAWSTFEVDLVLLTRRESVQWLTGAFVRAPFEPTAALSREGHATLVLPEHQEKDVAAADEVISYEGKL